MRGCFFSLHATIRYNLSISGLENIFFCYQRRSEIVLKIRFLLRTRKAS